jgi:hypothetical protein
MPKNVRTDSDPAAETGIAMCAVGRFVWFSIAVACAGLLAATAGNGRPATGAANRGPVPRVTRVSPPEARGAVEASVALNPTNPDHMIAVPMARMREHPASPTLPNDVRSVRT